jgi:hypothetical protein
MERNLEIISVLEEEEEQVEIFPQPRPVMIPAETFPTLRQRSTRTIKLHYQLEQSLLQWK